MESVAKQQLLRTKILENSENRLQRILQARNGLIRDDTSDEDSESDSNESSGSENDIADTTAQIDVVDANGSGQHLVPSVEIRTETADSSGLFGESRSGGQMNDVDAPDVPNEIRNRRANDEIREPSLNVGNIRPVLPENGEFSNFGTRNAGSNESPRVADTTSLPYKYMYMFMAVVVRILMLLGIAEFIRDSAVIPFMGICTLHIALQYVINAEFNTEGPAHMSNLMSLLGLPETASRIVLGLYNLFVDIFKYFSLYMFTFVCFHLIIDWFFSPA